MFSESDRGCGDLPETGVWGTPQNRVRGCSPSTAVRPLASQSSRLFCQKKSSELLFPERVTERGSRAVRHNPLSKVLSGSGRRRRKTQSSQVGHPLQSRHRHLQKPPQSDARPMRLDLQGSCPTSRGDSGFAETKDQKGRSASFGVRRDCLSRSFRKNRREGVF